MGKIYEVSGVEMLPLIKIIKMSESYRFVQWFNRLDQHGKKIDLSRKGKVGVEIMNNKLPINVMSGIVRLENFLEAQAKNIEDIL